MRFKNSTFLYSVVALHFLGLAACNPLVSAPQTDSSFLAGAPPVVSYGPMTLSSASVPSTGASVVIEIAADSVPPILPSSGITGFSVQVNALPVTVSSATRTANSEVTLALAVDVSSSDAVSISYSPGNLTDSAGTPHLLAGFTNQAVINNSTWDPDVIAYVNAIVANGGTISATTQSAAQTLVSNLKSNGLWTKLIEIYPMAGNQIAAALIKLKTAGGNSNTLMNTNFAAADYLETGVSGGFQGNGTTKYLDTNLSIPSLTINSISLGAYVNVDSSNAVPAGGIIGSSYFPTGNTDRFYVWGSGNNAGLVGQAAIASLYPGYATDGTGLRLMTYDGNSFDTYKDTVGSSISASGLTWQKAGTIQIFRAGGTAYAGLHDGRISFAFVGNALTSSDVTNLYSCIQAFETALSREI